MFCGQQRLQSNCLSDLKSMQNLLTKAAKSGNVSMLDTTIATLESQHGFGKVDLARYVNSEASCTELHTATKHGHLDMVVYLLSLGFAISRYDPKDGLCPLHVATIHAHKAIVRVLLSCGANVTAKVDAAASTCWKGMTPLDIAVGNGDGELTAMFLLADPNAAAATGAADIATARAATSSAVLLNTLSMFSTTAFTQNSSSFSPSPSQLLYALAVFNHRKLGRSVVPGRGGSVKKAAKKGTSSVATAANMVALTHLVGQHKRAAATIQRWWSTVSHFAERQHKEQAAATMIQAQWRRHVAQHHYQTIMKHSQALQDRMSLHAEITSYVRNGGRLATLPGSTESTETTEGAIQRCLARWPTILQDAIEVQKMYQDGSASSVTAPPPPPPPRGSANLAAHLRQMPPRFYCKEQAHRESVLVYNRPSSGAVVLDVIAATRANPHHKTVFQREWGAALVENDDGQWLCISNPKQKYGRGQAWVLVRSGSESGGTRHIQELRTSNYLAMGPGCLARLDVEIMNLDVSVTDRRSMDEVLVAPTDNLPLPVTLNWTPPKHLAEGPGPIESVLLGAQRLESTSVLQCLCRTGMLNLSVPVLSNGGAIIHACVAANDVQKLNVILSTLSAAAIQPLLQQVDSEQMTPLMVACASDSLEAVTALLQTGVVHANFVQTCYPPLPAGTNASALVKSGMALELELDTPSSTSTSSTGGADTGDPSSSTTTTTTTSNSNAQETTNTTVHPVTSVTPAHITGSTRTWQDHTYVAVSADDGSFNKELPLSSPRLHPPGWASLHGATVSVVLRKGFPTDILLRKSGAGHQRSLDWGRYEVWHESLQPRTSYRYGAGSAGSSAVAAGDIRANHFLTAAMLSAPKNAVVAHGQGESAASIATKRKSVQILQALIQGGADVTVADGSGSPLLLHVLDVPGPAESADVDGKRIDVQVRLAIQLADILLGAGCRINQPHQYTGETPLMRAASWPDQRLVDHFLACGADPSATNQHGETVLCVAARDGCAETVKSILSATSLRGQGICAAVTETRAVLSAATAGKHSTVDMLLKHQTPLGLHAEESVKALLACPEVSGPDNDAERVDKCKRKHALDTAGRVVDAAIAAAQEKLAYAHSCGDELLLASTNESRTTALSYLRDALASLELCSIKQNTLHAPDAPSTRRSTPCTTCTPASTQPTSALTARTLLQAGGVLSNQHTMETLSLVLERSMLFHDIDSFYNVVDTLRVFPWSTLVGTTFTEDSGIVRKIVQAYELISNNTSASGQKWKTATTSGTALQERGVSLPSASLSAKVLIDGLVHCIVREAPQMLCFEQTAMIVDTILAQLPTLHVEQINVISALLDSWKARSSGEATDTRGTDVRDRRYGSCVIADFETEKLELDTGTTRLFQKVLDSKFTDRCGEYQVKNANVKEGLREAATAFLRQHAPDKLQCCTVCDTVFDNETRAVKSVTLTNHEHFKKRACAHVFCKDCLKQWVEVTLNDNMASIKCPSHECDVKLFADDVKRIAGVEVEKRFVQLHSADHRQRLLELLKTQKALVATIKNEAKPCPLCCIIIYKYAGCDSMLCSCGHRFQWSKVSKWPTIPELEKNIADNA